MTGRLTAVLATKMAIVTKWDHILQALTAGHGGIVDAEQRRFLATHGSFFGICLLQMCRSHGSGRSAQLGFPRGGMASLIEAALTRADVEAMLEAIDLASLGLVRPESA